MKTRALVAISILLLPAIALAYPNGTPLYVTDLAPVCASCHSAARAEYVPELPEEEIPKELPEMRHYGLVTGPPPTPYMELTDEQKEKIRKEAEFIDSNSAVTVTAPARARRGGEIKVIVKAKGGNGPVIGIMLVDRALRYQARPAQSAGWQMAAEPVIKGQDGAVQKTWLAKRIPGLRRDLNFVLVFDEKYDLAAQLFPSAEVTYSLKAPSGAGTYPLTAAFLYGTENTDRAGFFQRPSGRILFSEEIKIVVD